MAECENCTKLQSELDEYKRRLEVLESHAALYYYVMKRMIDKKSEAESETQRFMDGYLKVSAQNKSLRFANQTLTQLLEEEKKEKARLVAQTL